MAVFKNFPVQIPEGSREYADGRIVDPVYRGQGDYDRYSIGIKCEEGMMYPNWRYFRTHQKEWKEQYPDEADMLHCSKLGVGMFGLTLAIGTKTGLYPALCSAYGDEIANGIMDFAMYSILSCSNVASTYQSTMNEELVFSIMPRDDKWFSLLFSSKMQERDTNRFRSKWLLACINMGIKDVYISIDGTNIEYSGKDNDLGQVGKSKSGEYTKIIACMWVVCANGEHKGMPITYFAVEGNKVDSVSFRTAIQFLMKFDLKIAGVIADRGFCTADFIKLVNQKFDYVVMLTENTNGYKEMIEEYSEVIKEKVKYSLEGNGKYGTVDKKKVFASSDIYANIAIIYDPLNGVQRRNKLIFDVYEAISKYNFLIQSKNTASIEKKNQPYVIIDPTTKIATINEEALQVAMDYKGIYQIVTSIDASAKVIDDIYNLRDASEKAFNQFKTPLGGKAIRVHTEESTLSKLAVSFVSAIIRSEIMNACIRNNLITKKTISEISRVGYSFLYGSYEYDCKISQRLSSFCKEFDLTDRHISNLYDIVKLRFQAEDGMFNGEDGRQKLVGKREFKEQKRGRKRKEKRSDNNSTEPIIPENEQVGGKIYSEDSIEEQKSGFDASGLQNQELGSSDTGPKQLKEEEEKEEKKDSATRAKGKEKVPGSGRGRKLGSKNKATLEREKAIAEGRIVLPPKRDRGRPANPETLLRKEAKARRWEELREQAKQYGIDLPEKQGRGRPPKLETLIKKYTQ